MSKKKYLPLDEDTVTRKSKVTDRHGHKWNMTIIDNGAISRGALCPPDVLELYIDMARNGGREYHSILADLFKARYTKSQPISDELRAYIWDVLEQGLFDYPKRRVLDRNLKHDSVHRAIQLLREDGRTYEQAVSEVAKSWHKDESTIRTWNTEAIKRLKKK